MLKIFINAFMGLFDLKLVNKFAYEKLILGVNKLKD
jgi:hypothetical protein